tara:strand:- start:557 stop:1183 length:627 start_codon:yes stop_codon:yes gene_type:complete
MNTEQYKNKLFSIIQGFPKNDRGIKYIRKWDYYWSEKEYVVNKCNLTNVKSAIDIGTGVGMLPYMLMQKGIKVEGTDIEEEITGPIFKKCCDIIGLKVHHMYINNNQPMDFPGYYDLFIATRTEFDREALQPGEQFNWEFFFNDVFKYVNQVFIKTNNAGSGKGYPAWMRKYLWNPTKEKPTKKPFRAWYIIINKQEWLAEPLSTLNN